MIKLNMGQKSLFH